ncbi:MAG: glutathione synthase, partial [Gammaproteobacteria bacterium]|nr:glutathione synthase [Gammaproteobacteria bacterium]
RVESPLDEQHAVLMRKDPPFDMEYINTTYLLELAEQRGTLVVNKAQSLRDANEKLFITHFPQCCAPTLVTASRERLRAFIHEQQDVVIKPLGLMGGASIFRVRPDDGNLSVILETMTQFDQVMVMAQRYLPEILQGDKRILLVDGKPVPYALARIPAKGELRGNLAAGGRGEGVPLTTRDYWLCEQIAPELKKRGLLFVGLDVIGDYVTEINVTSPTCIRELDAQYQLDIAGDLMDVIAARLATQ